MKMKTETSKKRLVFSCGGKGGVGKTMALLCLIEAVESCGVPYAIIDADTENRMAGGISSLLKSATQADLRCKRSLDSLLEHAATNHLTIVDLPANAGGDFLDWFSLASDPEVLDELRLEIWAIGVVTPAEESLASVCRWAAALQSRARYAIALNRLVETRVLEDKETVFAHYFSGVSGRKLAEGVEFVAEIPGLYEEARTFWMRSGGLPSHAAAEVKIPVLNRSRLRKFAERAVAEWSPFVKKITGENGT